MPFRQFTPSDNVIVNDRTGKRESRRPMTAAVGLTKTNTLSVWDRVTGTSFLVDTGGDVCVFPTSSNDKRKRIPTENLTAANGSKINTWGRRVITFTLGQGKRYHQNFYLADVARPILGAIFSRPTTSPSIYADADFSIEITATFLLHIRSTHRTATEVSFWAQLAALINYCYNFHKF